MVETEGAGTVLGTCAGLDVGAGVEPGVGVDDGGDWVDLLTVEDASGELGVAGLVKLLITSLIVRLIKKVGYCKVLKIVWIRLHSV